MLNHRGQNEKTSHYQILTNIGAIGTLIGGGDVNWYSYFVKMAVLIKINIHLPRNYTPHVYTREKENVCSKKTCTRMFIAALFLLVENWKQPRCFISEGE